MRSIWNGTISFGLVSIAVKLYSATEEKQIRFHQIHAADGARVRYQRMCVGCGEEVAYDDLARGYDLGGGELVVLTDDDFAGLPLSSTHTIDVLEFVPAEQIDPILYARAYYLEPDPAAVKPYVLLREALVRTNRVAIVKVALRQREQVATLRVRGTVLVLNTMLWPDEVREPVFPLLDSDLHTRPAELAMASSLIESMATDFQPKQFADDYRSALQAVIEAKVAGRGIARVETEADKPAAVSDLMAALRASVERAQAARAAIRSDPPDVEREPAKPAKKARKRKALRRKALARKARSSA